jgi:hypothetical protein
MRHACTVRGVAALVVTLTVATAACSNGPRRLPSGPPLAVVLAAADHTMAAGGATVIVADPTQTRTTRTDLAAPFDPIEADAVVALDLVRGAVQADPYGGQGVRGASTMRYDVSVDFAKAIERTPPERRAALERLRPKVASAKPAEIAVWVDVAGRARRVQRSLELAASPPVTTLDGFPAVVTTDYYGFP